MAKTKRTKDKTEKELLGEKTERVLKRAGVDRIAKMYERARNKPCKCKERKAKLNQFDQNIRARKRRFTNKK